MAGEIRMPCRGRSGIAASATVIRAHQEYPTIQAGINAAEDGDTVQVADGTNTGYWNRDIGDGDLVFAACGRAGAVAVYDVCGALVHEVMDETVPAGIHQVVWDGREGPGGSRLRYLPLPYGGGRVQRNEADGVVAVGSKARHLPIRCDAK